jgi:putative addiction module component (TIGR02574 family)
MAQSLPDIEKDALRLPPQDRARLAVRLLSSLEGTTESPEEIEKLWIAEAERRFQELRDGVVQGIPAQEVFAELRNKRS